MKRIGVITSGGDAPGMNTAVRAVVRTAVGMGAEVVGYPYGYRGILGAEARPLTSKDVGGIINKGGTILQTARCQEFREKAGRQQAVANLRDAGIEGLVVIGGDGSLTGALALYNEFNFPVMGVPGSIDNDLAGSDYSIGFDTAVNTALEAIDKVRDTAYSHDRVFVVEVMGRANGMIALEVALASGTEAVIIPEVPYSLVSICDSLRQMRMKGKRSSIIVVAEGAARASDVKDFIQKETGFEARYLVLGHMQRGGSPSQFDRVLSLRLGNFAVQKLLGGVAGEMVGLMGNKLVSHPLSYVLATKVAVDPEKLALVDIFAR